MRFDIWVIPTSLCQRETRQAFQMTAPGKQKLDRESLPPRVSLIEPSLSRQQVRREREMPKQPLWVWAEW